MTRDASTPPDTSDPLAAPSGAGTRERLGDPPPIAVHVVRDTPEGARCDKGFLKLRRLQLQNRYQDGSESEPYPYDIVDRAALDAVVMVLHRPGAKGQPEVCLRSSLRPPLGIRAQAEALEGQGRATTAVLWEVPAGLIEPEEGRAATSDGMLPGVRSCAARETLEETGFVVPESAFQALGRMTYLSPGVLAERLHYVSASLAGCEERAPTLDGSPVEEGSAVVFLDVHDAIAAIDRGEIQDAKTEVALRRFHALWTQQSRVARGPSQ